MAAKVKALQAWCKAQCDGYRDVNITNMTSSWKSGLAFCAMIHRYRPDLIDYDSLSKEDVFENNQLAFEVAERELKIPALLDAEDMVAMAVPDKLCIVTYVAQYYNHLGHKEKLGGPGVKGKTGTKRQLDSGDTATDSKKAHTTQTKTQPASAPKAARRGSTLSDVCGICKQKVYVMERHMEGSKLYHRRCIREQQRSLPRKPQNDKSFSYTNQANDRTSPGKENLKPVVTSQTALATKPVAMETTPNSTKPSNQLLTKVYSPPKPYVPSTVSSDIKTTSSNGKMPKSTVPKSNTGYSSSDDSINTSNEKPKFKAHFYGKKENNPLLKSLARSTPALREEPMDTSLKREKYEIVGRVVNQSESSNRNPGVPSSSHNDSSNVVTVKTFAGSQPMTANVTRTNVHKAGDSGSDTQVLQGLLKNLAGVRTRPVENATRKPEQHAGKPAITSPPAEAPAFTSVILKPTLKPDISPALPTRPPPDISPALPTRPSPDISPALPTRPPPTALSLHTQHTHATDKQHIPKPTQRQNKLITDQDIIHSSDTPKSKYSQNISKHTETGTDTGARTTKYSPKPILKNREEVSPTKGNDKRVPIGLQKGTAYTPPLSVFKSNDKHSLLSSVQLDSSDEFENKMDTSEKIKKPCVISTIPPRPSVAPVGVKITKNSDFKHRSPVTSNDHRSVEKPKAQTRTSPPKPAWQIELEARQGIRQHEPKRTGVNLKTRDISHLKQANDSKTSSETSKPEWQVEAEKRQAQRKTEENKPSLPPSSPPHLPPDSPPVAPPRRKAPPRPKSPPKVHGAGRYEPAMSPPNSSGGPSYDGLDMAGLVEKSADSSPSEHEQPNHVRASVSSDDDPFGRTSKTRGSGGVSRKPAFKVDEKTTNGTVAHSTVTDTHANEIHTDDTPSWMVEAQRRNAARGGVYVDPETHPQHSDHTDVGNPGPKRKILPDTQFTFSYDFEAQNNTNANEVSHPWGAGMKNRPLPEVPTLSPPKRKVNAEERMAMHEIIEQLEHLDAALQILEYDGRALEDKIRLGTDEDMDEDVLMVQWFDIVNQKNELVRKETDLMFKKKQQELEDEHEDIEYELRCLMEKPDHLKMPSEKVREESLLQELMDTVSLRNSIVDTIEENRIKYIEEDKEIAQVMAMRGFCKNPPQVEPEKPRKNGKKKKAKKNGKEKRNSNGVIIDTKVH